jgi:hypothetical protein
MEVYEKFIIPKLNILTFYFKKKRKWWRK